MASFLPANSQLIVKNTDPNLTEIETLIDEFHKRHDARRLSTSKSGLLPVKLELPATGRIFEFKGHQKPEVLVLGYQTWERQMAKACFWLVVGFALFLRFGRRGTVWRTLTVAVVLTCLPIALLPAWLAACNALLLGWLIGLAVWLLLRVARWADRSNRVGAAQEGGVHA